MDIIDLFVNFGGSAIWLGVILGIIWLSQRDKKSTATKSNTGAPNPNASSTPQRNSIVSRFKSMNLTLAHILLIIGGFLIATAIFLFIGFSWSDYSITLKMVMISALDVILGLGAFYFRDKQGFKSVYMTLHTLFVLALGATGIGIWRFLLDETSTLNYAQFYGIYYTLLAGYLYLVAYRSHSRYFALLSLPIYYLGTYFISNGWVDTLYLQTLVFTLLNGLLIAVQYFEHRHNDRSDIIFYLPYAAQMIASFVLLGSGNLGTKLYLLDYVNKFAIIGIAAVSTAITIFPKKSEFESKFSYLMGGIAIPMNLIVISASLVSGEIMYVYLVLFATLFISGYSMFSYRENATSNYFAVPSLVIGAFMSFYAGAELWSGADGHAVAIGLFSLIFYTVMIDISVNKKIDLLRLPSTLLLSIMVPSAALSYLDVNPEITLFAARFIRLIPLLGAGYIVAQNFIRKTYNQSILELTCYFVISLITFSGYGAFDSLYGDLLYLPLSSVLVVGYLAYLIIKGKFEYRYNYAVLGTATIVLTLLTTWFLQWDYIFEFRDLTDNFVTIALAVSIPLIYLFRFYRYIMLVSVDYADDPIAKSSIVLYLGGLVLAGTASLTGNEYASWLLIFYLGYALGGGYRWSEGLLMSAGIPLIIFSWDIIGNYTINEHIWIYLNMLPLSIYTAFIAYLVNGKNRKAATRLIQASGAFFMIPLIFDVMIEQGLLSAVYTVVLIIVSLGMVIFSTMRDEKIFRNISIGFIVLAVLIDSITLIREVEAWIAIMLLGLCLVSGAIWLIKRDQNNNQVEESTPVDTSDIDEGLSNVKFTDEENE